MPIESLSSIPEQGRINQKMRTRRELLRGARELMEAGQTVTIAAAAKRVGISTATAYRYFSDPETLRVEAVVEMDLGATAGVKELLEETFSTLSDPTQRLIALHRILVDFVRQNEPAYRLYIAKEQEHIVSEKRNRKTQPGGPQRLAMIEQALSPVRDRMSAEKFQETIHICAATCGPEPYFVLKDFSNLPESEIDRICELNLQTVARTLLGDL